MRKLQIGSDPSTSDLGFLVKLDLYEGSIVSSELGYEDENSMISLAIISKTNSVKKIKKLFTNRSKYCIILL